jgi:hypothetical protein
MSEIDLSVINKIVFRIFSVLFLEGSGSYFFKTTFSC